MPCHILLAKLAAVAGEHVLAHLPRLVPPLEATLTAKVKSDAVKQEVRPALRTASVLSPHARLRTRLIQGSSWGRGRGCSRTQ